MYDENGRVGLMSDPFAHAPESAQAVQPARADDDEVCVSRARDEGGDRVRRVPAIDPVGPATVRTL